MNVLVPAAPSDTTPPTRIVAGFSYAFLTFDFTMVLPTGATVTSATLTLSNSSFISVPSQSISGGVVRFLILTTMADGDICSASCSLMTSIGSGDARTVRLVAYDSGIVSSDMPSISFWLTNTQSITVGEINDGAEVLLTIPVANAPDKAPVEVTPSISTPLGENIVVVGPWVSSPGVVSFYVQNQSGANVTIGAISFTAVVTLVA